MSNGWVHTARIAVTALIALTLGGCVSTRTATIGEGATQGLKGQTVVLARRAKPDFAAMTAGKASFGMIGAFAMISAGNKLVADDDIDDPAVGLGHALLDSIVASDGAIAAPEPSVLVDSDEPARLAAAYPGAAYVLDVRTINWSYGYYPLSWAHYRALYSVKVKLVDARSKSVVAEGFCFHNDDDEAHAPTQDELLANKAERLKGMLKAHAETCLGELRQKVLGLKS